MSDLTDLSFYRTNMNSLNNAGKYCDIALKIMVMLQNVCENWVRILEEGKHRQPRMFIILWKKVKETGIHIDKAKREKPKNSAYTREYCCWAESVCEAPSTYQFTIVLNNWTFQRHHSIEFCIKTLYDAIQSSIGSGVEANWPSNAFSLR